jgi:hypothetical protein
VMATAGFVHATTLAIMQNIKNNLAARLAMEAALLPDNSISGTTNGSYFLPAASFFAASPSAHSSRFRMGTGAWPAFSRAMLDRARSFRYFP